MRSIYVFYQFFYPDDVVSSVHFSELCTGLAHRGWNVIAFPSNRGCRNPSATYPRSGELDGVRIERIWRPAWRQSSTKGRILNALWMLIRWSWLAIRTDHRPEAIIIGTDPILSVLVAIVWRVFKPRTVVAFWCFDLYPEAAFADGLLNARSFTSRVLKKLLSKAYRSCDLIVDIGRCMRNLLFAYGTSSEFATIVPWAMEEPSEVVPIPASERRALFDNSALALLYSGSFGRAHSYEHVLDLARAMRGDDVRLTFSIRGNREKELRSAVGPDDANIRFVPFTDAQNLRERLASADVHVVSLRDEWTGTVVPSKFFGALAIGRPVLFCGSRHSAIAQWIEEYDLGWVLNGENVTGIADSLRQAMSNPLAMEEKRKHCLEVYHAQFSRKTALDEWDRHLTRLLDSAEHPQRTG